MKPAKRIHRILCIDGGPAAPVMVRLLRKIEEELPGFLASTDLFAGTSDGAMLSMFLASRLPADQDEARRVSLDILDDAIVFSDAIVRALQPSKYTLARFLIGAGPLIDPRSIEQVLQDAFGDMRVDELAREFLVTSMDIDLWEARYEGKFCGYKLFDPNKPPSIIDCLMASSALPMYLPIHRASDGSRRVDGALFANNPTVFAALGLINMHADDLGISIDEMRKLVRVLSLGLGIRGAHQHMDVEAFPTLSQQLWRGFAPHPTNGKLDWGWFQWLLYRPMLLPSMLHYSRGTLMKNLGNVILEPGTCFRYEPVDDPGGMLLSIMSGDAGKVIDHAASVADGLWSDYESNDEPSASDTCELVHFVENQWFGKLKPAPPAVSPPEPRRNNRSARPAASSSPGAVRRDKERRKS